MNDFIVFGGVIVVFLVLGGLMNCFGGIVVEGWNVVNIVMVLFLVLVGGVLIWLILCLKIILV